MGGCDFFTVAEGRDAKEAFSAAVEQAQYMHGHGGYSGTIAEKAGEGFVMIPDTKPDLVEKIKRDLIAARAKLKSLGRGKLNGIDEFNRSQLRDTIDRLVSMRQNQLRVRMTPRDIAEALIDMDDIRIADSWGPAGCIDLTPKNKRKKKYLFFGIASS